MAELTFAELYERHLVGPLFRPFAETMLDEIQVSPGDRVLDIACGTGIVARVARQRLGADTTVVGVDQSADMLAVGRKEEPSVDWREGAAGALPLRDGERFDAVTCQQGLQFFPDKPVAARQMRQALAPGGRLAVATWRPDEESPFLRELRRVAERHVGAVADQRYGFGDAAALEQLLRDAGFHEVRSRVVSRVIRFPDGAPFVRMNAMALVGMSGAARAMDKDERARVLEAIVRESEPVPAFEVSTNLATARG